MGQFERFRRVVHCPHFSTLLRHTEHETLSMLQVCKLICECHWREAKELIDKESEDRCILAVFSALIGVELSLSRED